MRITLLAVLIALVACAEEPTTATQPAHTEPGVTPSGLSRANGRADGITPQNIAPLYTKYDCSKVNEMTWYCPSVGQVEFSDNPFWFDDRGGGQITWTGTDCSADPHACRFTSGGGLTGTYTDRDLSKCIPGVDPNCERVLTDVNRTKIVRALSDFVRDPAQIADATIRQRCQAMLNNFNLLLGLGRVYEGGVRHSGDGLSRALWRVESWHAKPTLRSLGTEGSHNRFERGMASREYGLARSSALHGFQS